MGRRDLRYVELKSGYDGDGPASISWVIFNRTGLTVYYRDRVLRRIHRGGVQGNYRDAETGEEYWVSGVKRDGQDRHWAGAGQVPIDQDAEDEYRRRIAKGSTNGGR